MSPYGMRANGEIAADPVAVVDDEGSHRILSLRAALEEARGRQLDLVEVAPSADPPACRIMDLDAFVDAARKAAAAARRKHT
ncbi:MAG TPA: hypothetical protein VFU93_09000 [Acidimicrobiales bacterium]|nr:hypothetical protein [Acidimicrobiales bacterium]